MGGVTGGGSVSGNFPESWGIMHTRNFNMILNIVSDKIKIRHVVTRHMAFTKSNDSTILRSPWICHTLFSKK